MPDHRHAMGHRLLGDDAVHHLPERGHAVLGDALVVLLPRRLDVVLGARGLLSGGRARHGAPPRSELVVLAASNGVQFRIIQIRKLVYNETISLRKAGISGIRLALTSVRYSRCRHRLRWSGR